MAGSGRQVETVTAEQAEVVGEDVTIQFLAELSAKRTAASTSDQPAKDGA